MIFFPLIRRAWPVLILALLSALQLRSQSAANTASPEKYFEDGDYNRALAGMLKNYAAHPDDPELNSRIGYCYLHINDDRSKALPYLLKVYRVNSNDHDICLMLGQAYMYHQDFDSAITFFNRCRAVASPKNYDMIDHLISNCRDAQILMRTPLDVTFQNMGKEINSKFPDYYPFVSRDGGLLYFTSRREGGVSHNARSWGGYTTADVYTSKLTKGQWTKAKSIGPMINTAEDEECVGVTGDGKNMIIYCEGEVYGQDIYLSAMGKAKTFPRPADLPEPLNSEEVEYEGSMTNDGNMIIIASARKGGLGGVDLWVIRKMPNGSWSVPFDPGANINTKYDEAFPVFDELTNTLYFASQGHVNMGGFDIFRSQYDPEKGTFGPAENIGYPINTTMDDMEFTLAVDGRNGYISAVRPGGFGDLDIYRVVFNRTEQKYAVITGMVQSADTMWKTHSVYVVLKNTSGMSVDSAKVNRRNGKYVISVLPGKYTLSMHVNGYEPLSIPVQVYDRSDYVFEIRRNITLLQTGTVAVPPKK